MRTDAAQSVQSLRQQNSGTVAHQFLMKPFKDRVAAGETGVSIRYIPDERGRGDCLARRPERQPIAGQFRKRVECFKFKPIPGGEGTGDKPALAQSLPETLNCAATRVNEIAWESFGIFQHEHQTGYAGFTGRLEFKLGIGYRLAWHQRSIPESDHGNVNFASTNSLPAVISRSFIPGGEILHIDRSHPRSAYGVEDGLHEWPMFREPRHVGGMAHEHLVRLHEVFKIAGIIFATA